MISVFGGFILAVAILVLSFFHSKTNLQTFLNPEGLLIVIGGSIALLFMTSQFEDLKRLARITFKVFLRRSQTKNINELLGECAQSIAKGRIPSNTENPFLDRALTWLGAGLKGPTLEKLLVDGAKLEVEKTQNSIQVISNLSKYPPALGMIGTVFGIIAIFSGLGQADGQKNLGINLAFAMTATLYGLITSNFLISPLSELLTQVAQKEEVELSMIIETVKLWSDNESQFYIEEHLELYGDHINAA